MITTALLTSALLAGSSTFSFEGGTMHDLARKLDDGTGIVISVNSNSNVKLKAFTFRYDDQKDFDRLLFVKVGLRRLGSGAYAARGYPLHVMEPPTFSFDQNRKLGQSFLWNSQWPIKVEDKKWVVKNKKDEPYRLGLFPHGLSGKILKMAPFFERLEVIVTSGRYEPSTLATKIANALGGKLKISDTSFEVTPNLVEVRRRFTETFNEKLSFLQPTDAQSQYDIATIEFSREMFGVAPDKAIEVLLRNENSDNFRVPVNAHLSAIVRKRALAYSNLPGKSTTPQSSPLHPSSFLESADWNRPVSAWLLSWPLRAGLWVWIKGKDQGMAI